MKRLYFTMSLMFFAKLICFSQNYFYLNDIRYESTKKIEFVGNRFIAENENIIIAKKNDGTGLFVIEADADNIQRIIGKLTIYLENSDFIGCTDRKMYDWINGRAITTYFLSISDITKLKKSNISTIRYNIKCLKSEDWTSEDGSYITENKTKIEVKVKRETYYINGKWTDTYINVTRDTTHNIPQLINDLFK